MGYHKYHRLVVMVYNDFNIHPTRAPRELEIKAIKFRNKSEIAYREGKQIPREPRNHQHIYRELGNDDYVCLYCCHHITIKCDKIR